MQIIIFYILAISTFIFLLSSIIYFIFIYSIANFKISQNYKDTIYSIYSKYFNEILHEYKNINRTVNKIQKSFIISQHNDSNKIQILYSHLQTYNDILNNIIQEINAEIKYAKISKYLMIISLIISLILLFIYIFMPITIIY